MVSIVPNWNGELLVASYQLSAYGHLRSPMGIPGIPMMPDGYRNGNSLGHRWVFMGIDGYFVFLRYMYDRWRNEVPNESRRYIGIIPKRSRVNPEMIPKQSRSRSGSSRDLGV